MVAAMSQIPRLRDEAKIREVGMTRQMEYHSQTSQYGSITRGARFLDLDAALKERMGRVLEEIRSGRFAEEWSANQEQAAEIFARVREARDQLPLTRRAFGQRPTQRRSGSRRHPHA